MGSGCHHLLARHLFEQLRHQVTCHTLFEIGTLDRRHTAEYIEPQLRMLYKGLL